MAGRRQIRERAFQQIAHAPLRLFAVTHLGDQFTDQRFGDGAAQRADRFLGGMVQRFGLVLGQVSDLFERGEAGLGDALGGRIFVE